MNFQQMILTLQQFWAEHNCIIVQPYDTEKGAGTMNPMTFYARLDPNLGKWPMWSLPVVLRTDVMVRT